MRHKFRRLLLCALLVAGTASASDLHPHAADWLSVHGDLGNQRYIANDQINRATVTRLGAVWISEPFEDGASSRMTPIEHDGLMFFAAGSRVYALDARSGKRIWVRQTETRTSSASGWQQMVTGLATTRSWGLGLGGGLLYIGLMNGHIVALHEKTGAVAWDQLINPEPLAIAKGVICTPLYVSGVLYLGLGMETTEGHAVAVDAKSGRILWRVPTLAEPGSPGSASWPSQGAIWRSGGGHPWTAGAADPSLGIVYFVTGNASPPYGGGVRPGNNLYTVSLIALDMKSGKIRWYQQLIHHDIWEADLSVPPVLFDLTMNGQSRHAIGALRGDGFLFVFDRATGKPLIPIEERPVPQNAEFHTSATQPFPKDADSILPACESWRSRLPAGFVLGCMFDPPSPEVPNLLAQWASVRIAPMSFDPQTSTIYAQGQNSLLWRKVARDPYLGDTNDHEGGRIPGYPRPTVVLAAIDTRTDKVLWRKELPSFDESGYRADGGALSTAGGLLFHQGGDGTLRAFDAQSGDVLWKFQTDYAVGDAPPMSYVYDGRQYVAFIAGTKVWAFALNGQLPQAAPSQARPVEEFTGAIADTKEIETMTVAQTPANGQRYFMDEYAFNPYRARVRAGSSVTFINNGYLPHTIVAADGSWTTGTLGPTEIKTLTFAEPGTYKYSSKEYPWSYGQLIVVAAQEDLTNRTPQSLEAQAQLTLGRSTYLTSCAVCHGGSLEGRERAPALVGDSFAAAWRGRDALALFNRIRTTMPQSVPGSLSDESYEAVIAFILAANGNPSNAILRSKALKDLPIAK